MQEKEQDQCGQKECLNRCAAEIAYGLLDEISLVEYYAYLYPFRGPADDIRQSLKDAVCYLDRIGRRIFREKEGRPAFDCSSLPW